MSAPSVFHAILGDPHYLWCPAPLEEVIRKLDQAPDLRGELHSSGDFKLQIAIGGQPNPLKPTLKGRLRPAAGGTLMEVRYHLSMPMIALAVLGLIFVGPVSILLLLFSFHITRKAAHEQISRTLEATEFNRAAVSKLHEATVADPTEPGSSGGAPPSFRVQARMNGAWFSVGGRSSGRRSLSLQSAGLQVEGAPFMDWSELDPVEIHTEGGLPSLRLSTPEGTLSLPIGMHSRSDQRWLVDHLNAHRARRSLSDADRIRARADRLRLAALEPKKRR